MPPRMRPQQGLNQPGVGRLRDLEKPNGVTLGWERLETSHPFEHQMFRVRVDSVRWPDGHLAPYTYVEAAHAVWVVPVTCSGEVVLIRQFRYTMDDWCWEIPAGGFHDFQGTPVELAQQELAEEVGGSSTEWQYVGSFRPGTSVIDMVCHIVLARNVSLDGVPQPEAGEVIEVHPVPIAKALEMARSGQMVDGRSALALLRCEQHIAPQADPTR